MDNVPSSAIMAIIAIVAACLIGAFIFTTVQSQKESGNAALTKVEGMNNQLDEADLTQYDGANVTGSQVKAAIKLLKDQEVSIKVINGSNVVQYNYEYDNTEKVPTGDATNGLVKITADDTGETKFVSIPTSKNNKGYITPSATYKGNIYRDSRTGVICQIIFTRQ